VKGELGMLNVLLARWQFGITTVYHFLFVPLTIGLAVLIAVIETIYVRTGDETYKRMAKFWGKMFLVNFALGVATGIMQEFQFGMNWSAYSRFVGDVFGPPLAIEALAAFFLESTFIAAWMFGWDRLSKRVHLLSIWLVAAGVSISALWILTANAFMQEPHGFMIHNGRAEMNNFWTLIGNPQLWVEFPHVWFGALSTGAFFMTGVSAWYLLKKRHLKEFTRSFQIGIIVAVASSLLTMVLGHSQAQHLMAAQPMKMAASEALWDTSPEHAPWSVFAIIDEKHHRNTFNIQIPYLLSILAYNHTYGKVEGINQLQKQYERTYGPGDYIPNVWVTYWSFRVMVLAGVLMLLLALYGLFLVIKKRLIRHSAFLRAMIGAIFLPPIAHTTGWIMTEMGRQPWVVMGLLRTNDGVSPTVTPPMIWTTLLGFGILYLVLGIVDVYLFIRFIRQGPDFDEDPSEMDAKLPHPAT
jgi:cytochrome d ubiquinol oxidase subunit I